MAYEVLLCLSKVDFFPLPNQIKYLNPGCHHINVYYNMYVLHISVFRSVQVIIAVFSFVLVILFEKLCQTGACVSSTGLDKWG